MALTKSESIWFLLSALSLLKYFCRASATETDEEGLRHLLLCRLILGKPELIISDSKQSYPSSIEFDSGVDNLHNPRKYVIWSSAMNSYILRVISSVSGLLVSEVVFMQDRARRGLEEAAKKKIYVSVLSARVISLPSYQVTLEAEVSNKGALALYGRLRFIRAKRLHHYYLNGMDAFRLKLLFPKPRLPQIASQYQTQQEQENFTG